MSTSDQDKAGIFSPLMTEDAGGALPPASAGLPDVTALAQMANEFFRALPGQAGQFGGAQSAVTVPSMAPQFGATPSSILAVPSADKLPSEADLQRLSGGGASSYQPEVAAAPAPATSGPYFDQGLPRDRAQSLPTGDSSSPFAQSLPSFESPFPLFESVLPATAPLATFPTEDDVMAALNSVSSLYFLEDAGALSKPTTATAAPVSAASISPSLLPDLQLPRKQFDVGAVRRDFPILQERVHGKPLIWLDNAATTQKPQSVIDRISYFYEHENSNIHRAAHELAARATDAYEDAREKVARFINASSVKEVVFVRGATEAINLVAQSWGRRHIAKDDEIVISWIEHHANIVPWQMLAAETGARLRVAPVDDDGQILLDEFEKLLGPKTRLVSVTQVSNALGTITPVRQMVQMAHRYGARVLVDGAQAVSHLRTDVQALDCDFYVFSGHKVFGPTGIGVLYGKPDALADTPPWQGGGNMIVDVTFEKTIYHAPPARFEAGTGNIADAVGLGAAIDYVEQLGMENIARYEHDLLIYATKGLLTIPGLRLIGTAKEKASVLSFVLDGFRTEEVGAALNREGIAVRSGHHCAQPALRRFGVETSVRPSLALYNNDEDVDALITALRKLKSSGA
ncbi:family 2A encapsulin nanocompartment cargo protein cysteine desulfurase [Granulicella sp. S156]|uniref:family 2A encapsulin nanocompartment cargo protein cysteine desulfurase n=1 Tax=Granulicella sp. S156 TaxID=1747224 RepID=UPI00131E828E|nr:family 2A encapsulin nanocompartment cargo protein cysteine desulfurase [Granulicella sp. S156]